MSVSVQNKVVVAVVVVNSSQHCRTTSFSQTESWSRYKSTYVQLALSNSHGVWPFYMNLDWPTWSWADSHGLRLINWELHWLTRTWNDLQWRPMMDLGCLAWTVVDIQGVMDWLADLHPWTYVNWSCIPSSHTQEESHSGQTPICVRVVASKTNTALWQRWC